MKSTREQNAAFVQVKFSEYATEQDFHNIFSADMESLYSLALVLTGNHLAAEEAFVGALADALKATVFKPWARSWSRGAVVERAIANQKAALEAGGKAGQIPDGLHPDLAAVVRLEAFDRFVFVLTTLERYSVRDCAFLLRRRIPEIETARLRAIAKIAGVDRQLLVPRPNVLPIAASA